MPIAKEKMNRILETLKSRLGAGQRGGTIPETLRAEPSDIVFFALQEPRKVPSQPFSSPRPVMQDMPTSSPLGMSEQFPMEPSPEESMMASLSQPTRPSQTPELGMDMSNLFDF